MANEYLKLGIQQELVNEAKFKKQVEASLEQISKNCKLKLEVDVTASDSMDKMKESVNETGKAASNASVNVEKFIDKFAKVNNVSPDKVTKKLTEMNGKVTGLTVSAEILDNKTQQLVKVTDVLDVSTGKVNTKYTTLSTNYAKVAAQQEQLTAKYKAGTNQLGKMLISTKAVVSNAENFGSSEQKAKLQQYEKELEDIVLAYQKLGSKSELVESDMTELSQNASLTKTKISALSSEMRKLGNNSMTMGNMISTAFEKFSIWIGVTTIFFGAIQAIKDGIEAVTELDSALVELNKVTDLTSSQLGDVTERASELGLAVGQTTAEMVSATAEFAKMGYTANEALDLAEQAAILTNVSDGIDDVTTASSAIISVLKAFNFEASDASSILDKINEVSNTHATSSSDLTEAIQSNGASMAAANNDIDETVALMTAANEVMQDASKVSTGLILVQCA
jgi:hypothetical protein